MSNILEGSSGVCPSDLPQNFAAPRVIIEISLYIVDYGIRLWSAVAKRHDIELTFVVDNEADFVC